MYQKYRFNEDFLMQYLAILKQNRESLFVTIFNLGVPFEGRDTLIDCEIPIIEKNLILISWMMYQGFFAHELEDQAMIFNGLHLFYEFLWCRTTLPSLQNVFESKDPLHDVRMSHLSDLQQRHKLVVWHHAVVFPKPEPEPNTYTLDTYLMPLKFWRTMEEEMRLNSSIMNEWLIQLINAKRPIHVDASNKKVFCEFFWGQFETMVVSEQWDQLELLLFNLRKNNRLYLLRVEDERDLYRRYQWIEELCLNHTVTNDLVKQFKECI
eukprot:839099_1